MTYGDNSYNIRFCQNVKVNWVLSDDWSQRVWQYRLSLISCTVELSGVEWLSPPLIRIPAIRDKHILWIAKSTIVCL